MAYQYILDTNILSDLVRHPQGQIFQQNDLPIAAHALALDLTLITAKTNEFARVPGLNLDNWLN